MKLHNRNFSIQGINFVYAAVICPTDRGYSPNFRLFTFQNFLHIIYFIEFYAVFHINPLVTNKAYCQVYSFFGGGGGGTHFQTNCKCNTRHYDKKELSR